MHRGRRPRSRHAADRREKVHESSAELRFVDAGLVLAVFRGFSVLGALGSVTSPPRGLFGLQLEKMRPVLGGDEYDRFVARTYECDWTLARLHFVGERADRIIAADQRQRMLR